MSAVTKPRCGFHNSYCLIPNLPYTSYGLDQTLEAGQFGHGRGLKAFDGEMDSVVQDNDGFALRLPLAGQFGVFPVLTGTVERPGAGANTPELARPRHNSAHHLQIEWLHP